MHALLSASEKEQERFKSIEPSSELEDIVLECTRCSYRPSMHALQYNYLNFRSTDDVNIDHAPESGTS